MSGTFRVPHISYDVDGPIANEGGFVWGGVLDGSNLALIQTGIRMLFPGADGAPQYIAWYECLPAGLIQFGNTISEGDAVNVSVTCTVCTGASTTWTAVLHDITQNWTATQSAISCGLNSADNWSANWIAETELPNQLHIVNFGVIPWKDALLNNANPNFLQVLQAGGGDANFTYANGTGQSGATSNPSIPNATKDGFKLCWGSGNNGFVNGTGFTNCKNDPENAFLQQSGHGFGF